LNLIVGRLVARVWLNPNGLRPAVRLQLDIETEPHPRCGISLKPRLAQNIDVDKAVFAAIVSRNKPKSRFPNLQLTLD
jgi:hypothetical protein